MNPLAARLRHSVTLLLFLHVSRVSPLHTHPPSSLVPLAMLAASSMHSMCRLPHRELWASFLRVRFASWKSRVTSEWMMRNTVWGALLPLRCPQGSDWSTLCSLFFCSDTRLLSSSSEGKSPLDLVIPNTCTPHTGASLCSLGVCPAFLTFFSPITVTFQIFHSRLTHKAC